MLEWLNRSRGGGSWGLICAKVGCIAVAVTDYSTATSSQLLASKGYEHSIRAFLPEGGRDKRAKLYYTEEGPETEITSDGPRESMAGEERRESAGQERKESAVGEEGAGGEESAEAEEAPAEGEEAPPAEEEEAPAAEEEEAPAEEPAEEAAEEEAQPAEGEGEGGDEAAPAEEG